MKKDIIPYKSWTNPRLIAACRERGLSVGGSRPMLIGSLVRHDGYLITKAAKKKMKQESNKSNGAACSSYGTV